MNVEKIKRPVNWVLSTFCIGVMVLLVVCVTWQVLSRKFLHTPSTVTDEIARFSMIWVGLLGAAYTVGEHRHIAIDLLTANLKGKAKQASNFIINLAIFLFALGTMVYGGFVQVMSVLDTGQISPSMRMPMAYVYLALPLSGLLIMFYSGLYLLDSLCKFFAEKGGE